MITMKGDYINMFIPYVIERERDNERSYDLYSRLLKDRIIFLQGEVNSDVANSIVAQLLFLEKEDDKTDITLYINSPGGSCIDGLAIYDTMNYIKPDVSTVVVGLAASMGSFISSGGAKGKRYALENSEFLIHQVLSSIGYSQASDIEIHSKNIMKTKEKLNSLLAKHTGKSYEQIVKDTDRDNYMTAQEALEYGLIDKIIKR